MTRTAARAAFAAAALLAVPSPARAQDPIAVGYSSDTASYISMVYESVDPSVPAALGTVTKADCGAMYTGTGDVTGDNHVYATYLAKVATTTQHRTVRPQDSLPASTGITCTLYDGPEGSERFVHEWSSARPGNAAYDVFGPLDVTALHQPKICVRAWIVYGDTTILTIDERCDRP